MAKKPVKEFRKDYEKLYAHVRESFGGGSGADERAKIFLNKAVFQFIGNKSIDSIHQKKKINYQVAQAPCLCEIEKTLSQFEYTIEENGADAAREAVGPDTLAKAFEGLSGRKGRKTGGVFYTPREIARYMCRASLKYYLADGNEIGNEKDTGARLASVKVCDPAAGCIAIGCPKAAARPR